MVKSIIYLVSCTTSPNKIYIGKTDRSLEARKKEHVDCALSNNGTRFHKELLEEGLKNWNWRVIDIVESDQVLEREKHYIQTFSATNLDLLNETYNKVDLDIGKNFNFRPKNQLKNLNRSILIQDGKIKPVINLTKQITYQSLNEAARNELDNIGSIRSSCKNGWPTLKTGNRFAFLDFNSKPILTEAHKSGLSRRELLRANKPSRKKKVKNLLSGVIFDSVDHVANAINVHPGSVGDVCRGKYLHLKKSSFCYIDQNNKEILFEKHLEFLRLRKQKYAVYHIDDRQFKRPCIFKSLDEIKRKLEINSSHIQSVIKGERQHINNYIIVKIDIETENPIILPKHREPIKKSIRPVICLDDNNEFESLNHAAKFYGLNSCSLGYVCKGKISKTRGMRFAFLDYENKPILTKTHLNYKSISSTSGKLFFCPQTDKEYKSAASFSRETGINQNRILKHLKDPSINLGKYTLISL